MDEQQGGPGAVFQALKANHLRDTLHSYGEALMARRKGIDKLNVYPVPDGDTGTNMSLTVQSVVSELKNAISDDMHSVSAAISKGAVMGARGNSGAILAQALRGIAESVKDKTDVGPADIADAFEKARTAAYRSVLKPVEGTMLTVLSAAAEAARKSADKGHGLKEQLDHVRTASAEALARTPELLPVLRDAGVVDAGGSGFLLFVDALRYVATGEPIPGAVDEDGESPDVAAVHTELAGLRYEVMYLMDAEDSQIDVFREAWSNMGDSIVVVGGDGLWNCHIHTDDIGPTIEAGIEVGRPYQIRITDLQEQAGAEHGAAWSDAVPSDAEPVAQVETAVIAVASGDGVEALFRDCGVNGIVKGGQSTNPSVGELLKAVESAPSQNVIILPNNKNVRMAADQVDELTDKRVVVVPSTSMVSGLATLIAFDSGSSIDDNEAAMSEANVACTWGEITQAVRASKSPAGPIKKGNWLGVTAGGIAVVTSSQEDALVRLVEVIAAGDHEIVTLITGEGAEQTAIDALREFLSQEHPNIEFEVHEGGQSLYPFYVGVE